MRSRSIVFIEKRAGDAAANVPIHCEETYTLFTIPPQRPL
jgi:hypothetical protein